MNDNENQRIDRSYADWDLITLHKSLNYSVKLPTQQMLRVNRFLMGNSEELELSDAMHLLDARGQVKFNLHCTSLNS